VNILDAVALTGIVVRKVANTNGGEYHGPCPGCGEGTNRFHVWPETNGGEGSYWCRQCGKGGDLVQFLKDFCGYSYKDAFEAAGRPFVGNYRSKLYRPVLPGIKRDQDKALFTPRHCGNPDEVWQARAEKLVEESHQALLKYDKALAWLKSRGLDKTAVQRFRLGWFGGEKGKPCAFRPRKSWGLEEMINEKTGRPKMLWIPRGLIIPWFTSGKVHRIRIRRPKADLKTDKDKKYYILPGSGMDMLSAGLDRGVVVIVEAELDAMLVSRAAGHLTGVVALGSASTRPVASVFSHLKKAMSVLVSLDYDDAGQGKTGWSWWKQNFKNARLWPVPQGKDPGEAWEKGVDIEAWIIAGMPAVLTLNAEAMGYQKPAGLSRVEELERLLTLYPVRIRATEQVFEILFQPSFKNQAVRQRINELTRDDEEVRWFLRYTHPDEIITGVNCNFDVLRAGA